MIGLTGIVSYEGKLTSEEREQVVRRMMETSNEDYVYRWLSLGNITLGLTQRASGNNKDLSITSFDNGLIGFAGYGKFRGDKKLFWADAMVDRIFSAFQEKGSDVLKELEGSFLCFLYFQDKFYMVSDRMGSKSCYTYCNDGVFLFSPSVTQAMNSGLIARKRNMEAVVQVLVSGFFLNDSSLVEGITRLSSATLLTMDTSGDSSLNLIKYWSMPKRQGKTSLIDKKLIDSFQIKMQDAIDEFYFLEPKSIVPLSGGLDSRSIACFCSVNQKLKTVTYNFSDEMGAASNVCKALEGDADYFTKKEIQSKSFHDDLTRIISDQMFHSVDNQYFYAPLFKKYFNKNPDLAAIYDGIYMDILFSAPYTYENFGFEKFLNTYGRGIQLVHKFSKRMKKETMTEIIHSTYNHIMHGFEQCDGVSQSQQCYMSGRLRRYVSESNLSRENYCYVFKPGYNYDLMDFGFDLNLKLRKGALYTAMLNKVFPDVMKIPYKDSYGNRMKTIYERAIERYQLFRLKLSYASQGLIRYYPYQAAYYFLHEKGNDEFRDLFKGLSYIPEIFDEQTLSDLFDRTKRKQYLLNLFSRVLFVQQFYNRNGF